ncbi:MAG: HD domain-containing protein [Planctomycetota bacterium]
MSSKLRRQIAFTAAQLMYRREESEYYRAKQKAARNLGQGWVKPSDLPSNAEIRDEIQLLARMFEGEKNRDQLRAARLAALRMMQLLTRFAPRLIGSVLTGHMRAGSDVDLHVYTDNFSAVLSDLDFQGLQYTTEIKKIRKSGEARTYRHVRIVDTFEFELTVYPWAERMAHPLSSITGRPIERAGIWQLRELLEREYPGIQIDEELEASAAQVDRWQLYWSLLLPLENVKQDPRYHPEGDALYHSLQVFDLATNLHPYDEEFLLAALLHDIGKAIDQQNHVAAGLEALADNISPRTYWLIEHHMLAHQVADRTIGVRALNRLRANESFAELLDLQRCDVLGRKSGVETTELEDAIDYVRRLDQM